MTDTPDAPDPDATEIYDETAHAELVCRVCGALVARAGGSARVHWDWHEAANGA